MIFIIIRWPHFAVFISGNVIKFHVFIIKFIPNTCITVLCVGQSILMFLKFKCAGNILHSWIISIHTCMVNMTHLLCKTKKLLKNVSEFEKKTTNGEEKEGEELPQFCYYSRFLNLIASWNILIRVFWNQMYYEFYQGFSVKFLMSCLIL